MNFDEYKVSIPFPYKRDFQIKKRIITNDGNAPFDDDVVDEDAYYTARLKYYEERDRVEQKRMNDMCDEVGILNDPKKYTILKFIDNYCDNLPWESYYDCLKELCELIKK